MVHAKNLFLRLGGLTDFYYEPGGMIIVIAYIAIHYRASGDVKIRKDGLSVSLKCLLVALI